MWRGGEEEEGKGEAGGEAGRGARGGGAGGEGRGGEDDETTGLCGLDHTYIHTYVLTPAHTTQHYTIKHINYACCAQNDLHSSDISTCIVTPVHPCIVYSDTSTPMYSV